MMIENLKTFFELDAKLNKEYDINIYNYITILRSHVDTLCDYYNSDEGIKLDINKQARVLIYYMRWAFEKAVDIYNDAFATAEITYQHARDILDDVSIDEKENINNLFRSSCNFLLDAYQNYTYFTEKYPELLI